MVTITDGVTRIGPDKHNYYTNFIQRSQEDFLQKERARDQRANNSFITPNITATTYVEVDNYDARVLQLAIDVNKLTSGQRSAYDKAVKRIETNEQLIMFISGEGGTGKTFVIALIQEYTRLRFRKQIGLYGATVAMAPTGCAANVVRGYTWQACYGKGRSQDKSGKDKMSSLTAKKVGAKFDGTKLLVLDEVSMVNLESLAEMSNRHKAALIALTEDKREHDYINSRPFGGVHILFTGDLWQPKAIGGHAVFSTGVLTGKALEGQRIWYSINEYSELTENYRFKHDITTTLQSFLRGARIGRVDTTLLDLVNARIVLSR
jgi:PIF1-like helicase